MKAHKRIGILLALSLALILSGCSGNNNKQSASGITLYWWRTKGDAAESTLKQMAQEYTSQNSGIRVEVVTVDPRTYEDEVLSALASYQSIKNAPDIFSINAEDLPRFAPQLTPATDNLFDAKKNQNQKTSKTSAQYVSDIYEPVVSKSAILNDSSGNPKVYGLPMGLDTLALYINNDAVQKAVQALRDRNKADNSMSQDELNSLIKQLQTAPTTWSEITKNVPYLTIKDGSNITQSAIALGTGANIERSADILETMMMQNGTQMTSADQNSAAFNLSSAEAGSATPNTNAGQRALDFYLQFSNPDSSLYTWNNKMPNDVEAFEQGQVAMIVHYADLYRFMIAEAPSIKNSIDVQPIPQASDPASPLAADKIKTMAKMNLEVAPSAKGDARRQQAAWNFIYYVTSQQGSNAYISAMKLASPIKESTGQPKFQAFADQKGRADLWYKGIKAQAVNELFITMIEDASRGKKSSKDAIDQAAKDTSTILSASRIKWTNASQGSNATSQ